MRVGHFSKCFYGIDYNIGKEIAVKFALNNNKIINYNKEGTTLSKLTNNKFYPKLYNFHHNNNKEYLSKNIMGPDLSKITNFVDKKFLTRKTIRNIGISLIEILEFIHYNHIVHRDIKPSNMVWGVYENNTILNKDTIYLIDFGESCYVGKLFFDEEEENFGRRGTTMFMSINAHLSKRPCPTDDIESMFYLCFILYYIHQRKDFLGKNWNLRRLTKKIKL